MAKLGITKLEAVMVQYEDGPEKQWLATCELPVHNGNYRGWLVRGDLETAIVLATIPTKRAILLDRPVSLGLFELIPGKTTDDVDQRLVF